ncbi:Protein involved in rRNA processing [Ceraceosorus bombacis]|uniref:Protein involved in rRNA processing n=1 Tax=Ceraceosorus bombacis TaxID=401625 RepID=A0A0P1B8G5_9BASI|nr:Protein involved in rRNA processing [Ceraceosorus bombacis]
MRMKRPLKRVALFVEPEIRLCLERVRALELRAKPGIDRVVRAAEESQSRIELAKKSGDKQTDEARVDGHDDHGDHDLLSFRPNLDAFASTGTSSDAQDDGPSRSSKDGIYRPPRLAPVPYTGDRPRVRRGADQVDGGGISSDEAEAGGPDSSRSRSRRALPRNASLLNDLSQSLSSLPYEASSSGSGGGALQASSSASTSSRARKLAEMQEYEESNLTRLATSGKEAKRRRKEEESLALGGGERGGGADSLMNEFGGLLSSGGGGGAGGSGRRKRMEKDAYEELRGKGRDKALDRARGRRGDAKGNPQFLDSAQTRPASLGKSKFKKDLQKERSKKRS